MTMAQEIMKHAGWEPGMLGLESEEAPPFRYMDDELRVYFAAGESAAVRGPPLADDLPDLDDRQTVDILFGQLRERFAAAGHTLWYTEAQPGWTGTFYHAGARKPMQVPGWSAKGAVGTVLLAGFRKVVELEAGMQGG